MDTFHDDYLDLNEMNIKHKNSIGISNVNLSTMTMIFDLGQRIDIEKLNSDLYLPADYLIKRPKGHNEVSITKRGKTKKSFFNQLTISYQDYTRKSIKIFSNGKVQMTGITNVIEGKQIARWTGDTVGHFLKLDNIEAKDLEIAMINTNYSFENHISILRLKDILIKENIVKYCRYNPDVYPGLKIKYDDTSVFVFATGNVVITGAKSLKKITECYEYITNKIIEHWKSLVFHIKGEKKHKSINTFVKGYQKHMFYCALKNV